MASDFLKKKKKQPKNRDTNFFLIFLKFEGEVNFDVHI